MLLYYKSLNQLNLFIMTDVLFNADVIKTAIKRAQKTKHAYLICNELGVYLLIGYKIIFPNKGSFKSKEDQYKRLEISKIEKILKNAQYLVTRFEENNIGLGFTPKRIRRKYK